MSVLLIHGFHLEEALLTNEIVRPFENTPDCITYQIKNPSTCTGKTKISTILEVNFLIEEVKPVCVIDVHHSFGHMNTIDIEQAKRYMQANPSFAEIYLWTFPIIYFFENPDTDPKLNDFLKKSNIGANYYTYFSNDNINPCSRAATKLGIPYIGLEANVNTNNGLLLRDEFCSMAIQASRKFIESIIIYYK